MAFGSEVALAQNPKLSRLINGYCARRGCKSYYADLSLEPAFDVDWLLILDNAERLAADESGLANLGTKNAGWVRSAMGAAVARYGVSRLLVAGVAVTVVTFLVWWWLRPPTYSTYSSEYQSAPVPIFTPKGRGGQ